MLPSEIVSRAPPKAAAAAARGMLSMAAGDFEVNAQFVWATNWRGRGVGVCVCVCACVCVCVRACVRARVCVMMEGGGWPDWEWGPEGCVCSCSSELQHAGCKQCHQTFMAYNASAMLTFPMLHTNTHMHTHTHTNACAHTHTHTHTYTHAHTTHAHTHAHAHAHAHTHTWMQEVYSAPDQAGAWDCVATCFFIDTAHNVLRYLEVGAVHNW
jgi:hypothetical protein